jgi:hypothetical protein
MRKLSLNLDDLQVESFPVQNPAAERGTVVGHNVQGTNQLDCTVICLGTMIACTTGCYTFWWSCYGTCFDETPCGSCQLLCGGA